MGVVVGGLREFGLELHEIGLLRESCFIHTEISSSSPLKLLKRARGPAPASCRIGDPALAVLSGDAREPAFPSL